MSESPQSGLGKDLLERQQTEEALRRSEATNRALLNAIPDLMFRMRGDGTFLDFKAAKDYETYVPPEQFLGRKMEETLPPEVAQQCRHCLERTLQTGEMQSCEYRLMMDGQVRDYEARIVACGEDEAVAIVRDITDRKRAEDLLRRNEEAARHFSDHLRTLHEVSIELSQANSLDALCRLAVERGRERFGFDRLSLWLVGDDPNVLVGTYGTDESGNTRDEHGAITLSEENHRRELFRERPVVVLQDWTLSDDRGNPVGHGWHMTAALWDGESVNGVMSADNLLRQRPLLESQKEILGLYGTLVGHLCTRMKAQEALRKSQERLRTVVNHAPIILFALDQNGVVTFVEGQGLEGLGWKPAEVMGRSIQDLFQDDPEVVEKYQNMISRREHALNVAIRRVERTYDVRWNWLRDQQDEAIGIIGVATDITDRMRLEAQLHQAQKMQMIGTLAGGIAHEFNNLLQAILGYAELLRSQKAEDDPDMESLERIQKAGLRAAELISHLLTFSRMQTVKPRPTALHNIVGETMALLERTLPRSVERVLRLEACPDVVMGDSNRLQQALLNLCLNARDAMPDGGRLVIATSNQIVAEDDCALNPDARPGRYVLLSVSDSGQGIAPAIRDRIFDPFFTTKPPGKGTGLGLALVYGIVRSHGGFLQVDSEPGHGTSFHLALPAADSDGTEANDMEGETARGGTETLLIVDDEEMLVELLRRMVERQGYRVITALGAEQALAAYEKEKDSISLVITDLIMPDMDGGALSRELMRRNPNVRILVSTGFSAVNDIDDLLAAGVKGVVMKPYQSQQLFAKIREALDS